MYNVDEGKIPLDPKIPNAITRWELEGLIIIIDPTLGYRLSILDK